MFGKKKDELEGIPEGIVSDVKSRIADAEQAIRSADFSIGRWQEEVKKAQGNVDYHQQQREKALRQLEIAQGALEWLRTQVKQ